MNVRFNENDTELLKVSRHLPGEVLDLVKGLYREFVLDRMSYLHRSTALWMNNVFEEGEDGPVYVAVAFDSDEPTAYVAYTLRAGKVNDRARPQEIKILDFAWLTSQAYRSIRQYLGLHDLVGRITWETAPIDDPAYEMFQEPRLLHAEDHEGAWFRVIDVPAALENRGYFEEGEIVVEVFGDDIADWNNGKFKLEVSQGEAIGQSTKESPDL